MRNQSQSAAQFRYTRPTRTPSISCRGSPIPFSAGEDAQLPDLASGSTVGFACVAPGALLCYTVNVATTCGHSSPMTSTQPPPTAAPDPLIAAAPITPDRNSEARRAYRESRTAIALLQQRWPTAFPEAPQQVRPLSAGIVPLIATALDWSHSYTRAVLRTWKLRPAYCRAVLEYPVRFDLNGNPTEQSVGEDARTMAKTRLDTWASKRRQQTSHKSPDGGNGTTTSSPTQVSDRRKLADSQTVPASGQGRSKSLKKHSAAKSTTVARP